MVNRLRIGFVSMHTSPPTCPVRATTGGMNVVEYHQASRWPSWAIGSTLITRRSDPGQADVVELSDRVRLLHLPAGPATKLAQGLIDAHRRVLDPPGCCSRTTCCIRTTGRRGSQRRWPARGACRTCRAFTFGGRVARLGVERWRAARVAGPGAGRAPGRHRIEPGDRHQRGRGAPWWSVAGPTPSRWSSFRPASIAPCSTGRPVEPVGPIMSVEPVRDPCPPPTPTATCCTPPGCSR